MGASRGYNMPFLVGQYAKPMPGLGNDPKLATLQEQGKITAFFGHPGPMSPAAQEVLTTFIVPDMKVVSTSCAAGDIGGGAHHLHRPRHVHARGAWWRHRGYDEV